MRDALVIRLYFSAMTMFLVAFILSIGEPCPKLSILCTVFGFVLLVVADIIYFMGGGR